MEQKQLSELEQVVMDIVWARGNCSARDILEEISVKRTIAYTTITTILQRLVVKGMVTRKASGIIYLYKPSLTKESYSKKIAQSFINKFFTSFGDVALSSFAESIEELPKDKQAYFLTLLKKYEKNK
jgi:BlaI family penicillinase repressor